MAEIPVVIAEGIATLCSILFAARLRADRRGGYNACSPLPRKSDRDEPASASDRLGQCGVSHGVVRLRAAAKKRQRAGREETKADAQGPARDLDVAGACRGDRGAEWRSGRLRGLLLPDRRMGLG